MSNIAPPLKLANRRWPIVVLSGVVLFAALLSTPRLHRAAWTASNAVPPASSPKNEMPSPQPSFAVDQSPVSFHNGLMSAELKSATPSPSRSKAQATDERKLVRTGSLELSVKSPADAAEQIRLMAESMGGYLESAQIGGSKDAPVASVTIRVPAARFEDAKASIRKLAARIESENTDAQDVTGKYVDREARLRNLRAEEAQYLTIMKSAYKVEDLLSVSQKLSEVRGEIEQQQAEFQTLSKQVETVAITISLRAVADAPVFGLNWRPLYQLKMAARDALDGLADYAATMTAVVFYLPVILAWSLTIFFAGLGGWRLVRWTGRRFFAWPAAAASPKTENAL